MGQVHKIVRNLVRIMNDREMNKSSFAEKIGFIESKWNKISNGKQDLNISDLSKIAEKLQMREIDIITYPDVYVDKSNIQTQTERFFVAFEVSANKRDYLLNSVLDDKENCKIVSDYKVNN